MKTDEFVLKGVSGYLFEELSRTKPSDCIEPNFPVQKSDLILSRMTDLEKRVYTVVVNTFLALTLLFDIPSEEVDQIYDFYDWLKETTRKDFLVGFKTKKNYQAIMAANGLESLIKLRRDFLSAYDLLEVIIGQRLDIDCDEQSINFRKGFFIVVDKLGLSSTLNLYENSKEEKKYN